MPEQVIQKAIIFTTPADMITKHTTHLVCQPLTGLYLLSFFEVIPPLIIGTSDMEKQQAWEAIKEIPATCVARLLVSETDMSGFIQCLQQQQSAMKQQAMQGFKAFA